MVHARVEGPHAGICLTDGTDGVFHRARRPHGATAGGDGARAQPLGKDLQQRDGVWRQALGVDRKLVTKGVPEAPCSGGRFDALARHVVLGCCLDSKPISAEAVEGTSVRMVQGDSWG